MIQSFLTSRFRLTAAAAILMAGCAFAPAVLAQTTPGGAGAATTPAQTPPEVAPTPPADLGEGANVETVKLTARPAAAMSGTANWDEGFGTLQKAFNQIREEMKAAGLAEGGKPVAVFLETDDEGFKYDAMIPLAASPSAGAPLSRGVKVSETPSGSALKFQHRAAYDDIDSTYEAITAYLDEKGLNAANVFIEEYLNDMTASDDNNLAIDIYVFLK